MIMCMSICLCNYDIASSTKSHQTSVCMCVRACVRARVMLFMPNNLQYCRMYTFFANWTVVATVVIPPMGLTCTDLVSR